MTKSFITMKEKKCNHCGKVKPLSEFNRNKTTWDGLQHWCKACMGKYMYDYRKHKGSDASDGTSMSLRFEDFYKEIPDASNDNVGLKIYSDYELIAELKSRGYTGKLVVSKEVNV